MKEEIIWLLIKIQSMSVRAWADKGMHGIGILKGVRVKKRLVFPIVSNVDLFVYGEF